MRLIDADKLVEAGFYLEKDEEKDGFTVTTVMAIEDIPTACNADKLKAKKPTLIGVDGRGDEFFDCPRCGGRIASPQLDLQCNKFCSNCGQKINWSNENDGEQVTKQVAKWNQ